VPLTWILIGLSLLIGVGLAVLATGGTGLILAAGCFLLLWFLGYFVALLIDEDLNHWDWPKDDGPGLIANVRMASLTGLIAAMPVGLVWFAVSR
jgi:hypothetical protein